MDLGTVQSVAQNLLNNIQCSELQEILSKFGYRSELEDLQRTVETIIAVFRDAETTQELSHEARGWIQELKDAVFEANNVLDKFVTLTEQKQQVEGSRGYLATKLSPFFSYPTSYTIYRGLKNITKKLDAIIATKQCKIGSEPIRLRWSETYSYVFESDIIGREDDLESIVGTLLASNNQPVVSFLSIVGMGGLGKTALAQLVYNDPRVKCAFSLRLWTCVDDHDQKVLDVKDILGKILASATMNYRVGSTMERLQRQVRDQLEGKKFLLVLDDVWNENHEQWLRLVGCLMAGQMGSWILVITRSQRTANIIGGLMYELQGLSEDNSWRLFEKTAFVTNQSNPPEELVKIGREIVHGCAHIPLAIRVAGSLLFGQEESRWHSFLKTGLVNIGGSENAIMPILKRSFDNLESPLKSCFNYFAMFPKYFEIDKQVLLSLWIAQGYVPSNEAQSIEEVAEEYFLILLSRYFFQDIKKDKYGEIVLIKIHPLMHDVACYFTNNEMCIANTISGNQLNERIQHVSLVGGGGDTNYTLSNTNIYSFLHVGFNGFRVTMVQKSVVESLIEKSTCLRALDLSGLVMDSLPESIGKLYRLRYLNLSGNTKLQVLPESITELINLQTLGLRRCDALKVLPKDLRRLVNLMKLDIRGCSSLTCMPRGMGQLARLYRLNDFIVGGLGSYSSWNQWFGGLEDLKTLRNLKGHLNIQIRWPETDLRVVKEDSGWTEPHMSRNHLTRIVILFRHEENRGRVDNEGGRKLDNEGAVSLMEEMQPNPSLKYLEVKKYHGVKMPGWITLLPNLVELHFAHCGELEYLPCLGNLHHLKVLKLIMLANLEYVGEDSPSASSSTSSMHMPGLVSTEWLSYYPSLETLELSNLPKLKSWKRGVRDDDDHHNKAQMRLLPCFSQLKSLFIWNCPEMTYIPACPMVEDIKLINFNKRLQLIDTTKRGEESGEEVASSSALASCSSRGGYIQHSMGNIKKMAISDVAWLNSLPVEALECIESLNIWCVKEVENLGENEEVLHSCSSSLRFLIIHNCSNLRSVVSGGLEHLTVLEELHLRNCDNLRLSDEEEKEGDESIDNGITPSSSLHHSLHTLTLQGLPQLVNLPNWIQFLPALQSLNISFCNRLKSMPAWMHKLACLRKLKVHGCSAKLNRRCQQDLPGEDWPFIQHIPHISISASRY